MDDIRSTLKPGDVFAGKYRIEKVLGEGGMGVVLSAVHSYTHDRVALKFLLPAAASSNDVRTRFLNEARAAVQIKSEHVGRVVDVDVLPSGVPYMVIEYLDGRDLGAVVAELGPLPLATAVDYVLQACEALAEAHSLGIVHRDLKPSNLFLTRRRDGSALVKVLDFGISKLGGLPQASVQLTRTSSMLGSPLYMSPEQMTNPKGVDARSDVWSMGVVLYELLTAEWPFMAETVQGLAVQIVTEAYCPIRSRRAELPEAIEPVIARCLEKRTEARFGSVGDLARALAPFASPTQASVSVDRVSRVLFGKGYTVEPSLGARPAGDGAVSAPATPAAAPASLPAVQATTAHSWATSGVGAAGQSQVGQATPPLADARRGPWPAIAAAAVAIATAAVGLSRWKLSTVRAEGPSVGALSAPHDAPQAGETSATHGPLAASAAAPAASGQAAQPTQAAQPAQPEQPGRPPQPTQAAQPGHAAPAMTGKGATKGGAGGAGGAGGQPGTAQPAQPPAPLARPTSTAGGEDFGGR
jgi:eukaryotic-like serine/threonine-protein kinase